MNRTRLARAQLEAAARGAALRVRAENEHFEVQAGGVELAFDDATTPSLGGVGLWVEGDARTKFYRLELRPDDF